MKLKLIDIHAHLDFPDYESDREDMVKRALDNNVGVITIGATMEGSKKAVSIAEQYEGIWACVGVHPEDADKKIDLKQLKVLARHEKVVAIGECGLDYFHSDKNKEAQKELFEKQIELALDVDKPLMIHCREAYDDVLDILNSYFLIHNSKLRGDVHFFAGNSAVADKFLALGFTLSFTGVITFTQQYDEVIKMLPMDKIMIETDSPFVAPVPYRGKRNEPIYVKEVARKIAKIKELTYEQVAEVTTKNAIEFFGLK